MGTHDPKHAIDTISRLMELAPYGVYICDADSNVVFANQIGRKFYGSILKQSGAAEWVKLGEMFTLDGVLVLPADFPMSRAIRGEIVHEMQYEIRKGKESVRVAISAHPLHEDGKIVGAMSIHRYA
ncbi:MAG: PAS domain-containing protein [Terriglobales bacterium]